VTFLPDEPERFDGAVKEAVTDLRAVPNIVE
jgi:hypothetical protein